jgi:hypothetical protein
MADVLFSTSPPRYDALLNTIPELPIVDPVVNRNAPDTVAFATENGSEMAPFKPVMNAPLPR